MFFCRMMISLMILFRAVPMWMLPLAYGGPSWSTNRGLPSLCFISWLYRSFLSQSSSMAGSFLGRPARISNRVLGRCRVLSYWDFVLGTGSTLLKNDCLPGMPAGRQKQAQAHAAPALPHRAASRAGCNLFAELDALEGGVIHLGGLLLVGGGQLGLVLVPEVLALGGGLGLVRLGIRFGGCRIGRGGVLVLCGGLGRRVGGVLGQAAEGLHMAAVEVQYVGLEAGHFQADPLILPLFQHALVAGLPDDLVGPVGSLLQQVVGVPDDVVAAEVGLVDDLLG